MIPVLCPSPPYVVPTKMIDVLLHLGLTTNLKLCLDAGDENSYASGQVWTDLSGGGYNFNRGATSGSEASDPTFNGVAGRQSSGEYFSYDGGDYFTLGQAAPAWQSGMHKAGGKFTILQWIYAGNLTGLAPSQASHGCGDNNAAALGADCILFTNSGSTQNALSVSVANSVPAGIVGNKSTLLVTNNAWQMIATAVDVDAGGISFAINGATETVANAVAGTPSSADSHMPLLIGAGGDGPLAPAINGCRIGSTAIWTRVLSSAELIGIFAATRARFGV